MTTELLTDGGKTKAQAYHAFYDRLKEIYDEANTLSNAIKYSFILLSSLDDCHRHDRPVDNERWESISRDKHPRSYLYHVLLRDLRNSLGTFEKVGNLARNNFRGEAKNKIAGLIESHRASGEKLLLIFEELAEVELQPSRLPFKIRQRELAKLATDAAPIAQSLVDFFRNADREMIEAELIDLLLAQQRLALQLSSLLARLRDNPSQKMRAKMQECLQKVQDLEYGLLSLMNDTADRGQITFIRRSGQTISFKETMIGHRLVELQKLRLHH